jgi:hypothetical protein
MAVDLLPEFQEFLKQKKIVPDKQIPFYAQWVSRFLSFLNRNSFTSLDIATDQFIIWLRDTQHVQDWQLRQAAMPAAALFEIYMRLTGLSCSS